MKYNINLYLFDVNTNLNKTTSAATGNDLSPEMQTFYDTSLLQNERKKHYFTQFGQTQPLPKGNGKRVTWRRFDSFKPALTPLTEGVTPDGNKLNMQSIGKDVEQYGDYTAVSDRLQSEAIDPVISVCTEEHGAQAGDTLDTIVRNEVVSGINVFYAGDKTSRAALTATDKVTPQLFHRVAVFLKKQLAPLKDGTYIAIIHPSVAYDLTESEGWIEAHKYATPENIYNGEIGKLYNIRFVEDPTMKVYNGNGSDVLAVYATIVMGAEAYGIIDPNDEGLRMIVKMAGTGGTSDPLEQRSTVGWKACQAAKILYQERIVRVESCATDSLIDVAN